MLDGCHLFSKKMGRYVIRALDILAVNYEVNYLLATSNSWFKASYKTPKILKQLKKIQIENEEAKSLIETKCSRGQAFVLVTHSSQYKKSWKLTWLVYIYTYFVLWALNLIKIKSTIYINFVFKNQHFKTWKQLKAKERKRGVGG